MQITKLSIRLHRAANEQLCPECGAPMTEVDHLIENEVVFIWYQCSKEGCTGRWLQKKPQLDFARA